jgi:hypothetical protein
MPGFHSLCHALIVFEKAFKVLFEFCVKHEFNPGKNRSILYNKTIVVSEKKYASKQTHAKSPVFIYFLALHAKKGKRHNIAP